jgi:diguanylate cyclase (GGDEF)-like protein
MKTGRWSLPLLLRFGVLSTLVVGLLGAALSTILARQMEARAHESAEEKARVIAVAGIEPHLSHDDLQAVGRVQLDQIDALLASDHLRATGVRRIKLFGEDGQLVYSDSRRRLGGRAADAGFIRAALAGQVRSRVVGGGLHPGSRERMLEVFVPLVERAHGESGHEENHAAGVLEVDLPYAPVADAIAADRRRLYVALAIGLVLLWVALFKIVAQASKRLRRQAAENRRLALHDALTGLPNRALLYDRLDKAFAGAERYGREFTMLLLDLDGFKEVNDSLGHHAGDEILRELAERLRDLVRSVDTVARLGGDEFAIVLADTRADSCGAFIDRLLAALRAPFSAAGARVVVGASLGIASSATASTPDDLLRNADLSMYQAKDSDQKAVAFEAGMYTRLVERRELEHDMRQALRNDELVLHYQPIVSPHDGLVRLFEALVRWRHPQRGLVSPGEFIPVAEQCGLIGPIGDWVLDEACRQLARWRRDGIVDREVAVSVNVSASQLRDSQFPTRVVRALARHELPGANLVLELTESLLVEEHRMAETQLRDLRRRGLRVALDDFGTGYSSLSRLSSLPVDLLKVDRSFVSKIRTVASGNPLTTSIIAMGHSLGLKVVAEGVETNEQLTALRRLGCDMVQGYLLARPCSAQDVAELLKRPFPVDRLTESVGHTTTAVEDELSELVTSLVTRADSSEELIRLVLADLHTITGLESIYLTTIDWEHEQQQVLYSANRGALEIAEGLTVPWSDTLCRRALSQGSRHVEDVAATYPDSDTGQELGLRSFLSVPVTTPAGDLVGTLCGASGQAIEVPESIVATVELFARLFGERLTDVLGSSRAASTISSS